MSEISAVELIYAAPPVPATRMPPREGRARSRDPPTRPPKRTSSKYGTPRRNLDDDDNDEVQRLRSNSRETVLFEVEGASHTRNTSIQFYATEGEQTPAKPADADASGGAAHNEEEAQHLRGLSESIRFGEEEEEAADNTAAPAATEEGDQPSTRIQQQQQPAKVNNSVDDDNEELHFEEEEPKTSPAALDGSPDHDAPLSIQKDREEEDAHSVEARDPEQPFDADATRRPAEEQDGGFPESEPLMLPPDPNHRPPTQRREVPSKSREVLMNERAWRTGMATTPRRKSSVDAAAKNNKENKKRTPSSKRDAPPEDPRPWRKNGPTPPSRHATPRQGDKGSKTSPRIPRAIDLVPVQQPRRSAVAESSSSPPVLTRSPWVVVAQELQDWTDIVNQQANLQAILQTMREREREAVLCIQRTEMAEESLVGIDAELYELRDLLVMRRGTDLMGNPLRPPRQSGRNGSMVTRRTGSSRRGSVSPRLYVEPVNASEKYMQMRPINPGRSCLSDEDVDEHELAEHGEELDAWREERAQLRAEKARLAQQHKEMRFHYHRGTNIKSLSAVTATASKAPLDRYTEESTSAIDAAGYDQLAKLRLDERRGAVAVYRAREQFISAKANVEGRVEAMEKEYEDVKRQHAVWKQRHDKALQALEANVQQTRQLLEGSGSSKHRQLIMKARQHVQACEKVLAAAAAEEESPAPRIKREDGPDVFDRLTR